MHRAQLRFSGQMTDRFPFDVIPAAVNMLSTCRPIQKNRSHGKLEQLCRELGKNRERAQAHSVALLPHAASYPRTLFPVWLNADYGVGGMMQLWTCQLQYHLRRRAVPDTDICKHSAGSSTQHGVPCQTSFSTCDGHGPLWSIQGPIDWAISRRRFLSSLI